MKIIEHGDYYEKKIEVECENCNCKIKINRDDLQRNLIGTTLNYVRCPDCYEKIILCEDKMEKLGLKNGSYYKC